MVYQGNALWQLVKHSDAMTWFVLLVLFFMSVMCWAIFLYKLILFHVKHRQMRHALVAIKNMQTIDELRAFIATNAHTLPGYVLKNNLSFLKTILESHPESIMFHEKDKILLQEHMEQTLEEVLSHEEAYMPFLFISASVSPLLGLFGTVWGLVHAFVRISVQQSADIATVAPGIAEALITTLAGLMVAIPALVMYHYVTTQLRKLEHDLIVLSDSFNWLVQRLLAR